MDLNGLDALSSGYDYDMLGAYKNNNIQSESFEDALNKAQEQGDEAKLKKACVEFESYFIKMMLSSMRSTVNSDDSFLPKSNAEKMFQDMLDEEYAKKAAEGGNGIGLAQMLYKQLSANVIKPNDINNEQ